MNYDVYQAFFIFRATTTAQGQSTFFFFILLTAQMRSWEGLVIMLIISKAKQWF